MKTKSQTGLPVSLARLARRLAPAAFIGVLGLAAAPEAWLWPPDPGVVHFHVAMQRFARGVHHRAPELVQQHPRSFVPAQPQLSLEQERRNTALVRDREIRRPEPHRQRRLGVVKNRARRQRDLIAAGDTLPPARARDAIGAAMPAARTRESVRPATRLS